MVIQDTDRPLIRPKPAEPPVPPEKPRRRWGVLGVQCIACVVAVLVALLLRGAGGSAYEDLRRSFRECLMRNDLMATLSALWDGDPLEQETSAAEDEALSLPEGVLAVPLRVTLPGCPPVASGKITSGYGYRDNPTGEGGQFHRGVDIAAPAGMPIAAMYAGRVTAVGQSASLGNYLRLDHGDGVEVLYAHCHLVMAVEGATVRAGEQVALVGATGDATGNHVHIQVSRDGVVYAPDAVAAVARYA